MNARSALKVVLVLATTAVVVGAVVFAWMKLAPRRVPDGQPPLATVRAGSLPSMRSAFNTKEGHVRVLALLSPT